MIVACSLREHHLLKEGFKFVCKVVIIVVLDLVLVQAHILQYMRADESQRSSQSNITALLTDSLKCLLVYASLNI